MHEDVRFSMPPTPGVWTGRSTVVQGWIDGGFGSEAFGSMRCVVTRANGQPAVAGYVRKPGDAAYEPLAIDVLRVQDGVVTERSEEHTSELQSRQYIVCRLLLEKKN